MPLVCIEALASSVPVVVSDVGGVSEVVKDYHTGFTILPGDVEGYVEAILNLLANKEYRRAMGLKGRELIEREHDWTRNSQRIISIYEKLI